MRKPLIVHIVFNDKFTQGYISFMKIAFSQLDHIFIIKTPQLFEDNQKDIFYFENYKQIYKDKQIIEKLESADKIIISGIFYPVDNILKAGSDITHKVYLHFWGGDFYSLRKCFSFGAPVKSAKKIIKKYYLKKLVANAAGVINLIPEDYIELCKILNVEPGNHFIAPMCGDPSKKVDIDKYKANYTPSDKVRIILGNSATITNNHIEALKKLAHIKDNIQVYCPLSYGDSKYAQKVIYAGKKLLGDSFIPLLDYMNKDDYWQLLYNCDIGVFNLDRQQALGNINTLLQFQKKVFLRKDSPLYNYYHRLGIETYDLSVIDDMSIEKLKEKDVETLKKNAMIVDNNIRNHELAIDQWRKVLFS